ncbi:IS66 family transposase [Thalassotalea sp. ND16A]|uniref:IS66 family transposase n=1 Tax=Thalassotalea sp. ND16A TaxID=1535422 RepID=UPI000A470D9E|nr:IS66 family transposase [Thalassotalea sp. ND16A]
MTKPTDNLSLEEKLAALQAQVESLQAENTSLQEREETLTKENTSLLKKEEVLTKENTSLLKKEEVLTKENAKMKAKIEQLLAQLKLSNSRQFGKSSEKSERGTFNEAEKHQKKTEPKHHKKGKKPLPEYFEREVVEHTLDSLDCPCCGEDMHQCGSIDSEQLKIIPAKISVIKHKQFKYACRNCEHTGTSSKIITVPKPKQPIPGSMASPEALAAVVTSKYCDALPLYRQAQIYARGELDISRNTLANWCIKAGFLIKPLVEAMQRHLVSEHSLCADETHVQVLSEEGKLAHSKSYMWVYRSNEVSKQPVVVYDYQSGRSRACVQGFLSGYQGYLQCDGYSVYDNIEGITPVGCWAHARRKYEDALKAETRIKGRANMAKSYIARLYALEKQAKSQKLTPEQRYQLRQEKAVPILDKFKAWLEDTNTKITKNSHIGGAINYTLNQWNKLIRYVDDGNLGIDNNVTERDIRPFTNGRKNWLFSKSVEGAEASANLYSIVMTCRANDINPYYYFLHLFKEIPNLKPDDDINQLMPWNVQLDTYIS